MEISQITLTARQLELLPMPLEQLMSAPPDWARFAARRQEYEESLAKALMETKIDDDPQPDHVLGG
jgi:hypothetical protein